MPTLLERRSTPLLACAATHHYKNKERIMRLHVLLAGVVLLHSPLTLAAWREASSEHFVIYADESERDLRTFSEKLERYHKAMTALFPSRGGTPSPSNRPTVYVVGNDRQVRKLLGNAEIASSFVQGFYVPRAGGSAAFIPPIKTRNSGEVSESEMILMHEYAHHFMYENLSLMVPPWFTEGFAEYFSSAVFEANGSVILGGPDNHRAYEFSKDVRQISIEELLDSATYAAHRSKTRYDNFYVRSWSLFHYLYSNQAGKDKMVDYLDRLNRGESELDSARAAFGDLAKLDRELERYLRNRIPSWRVFSEQLSFAPIAIRELNPAEVASLAVRMQSDRGIEPDEPEKAEEIAQEARELAANYPDEPEVLAALAEAEYDAENDEAAIAAADQALALNPTHMNALIQKGLALTRIASATKDAEAWAAVRSHFLAVNKIEPEHPIPLLYYFLSYPGQGMEPTQNAIDGLELALQLAPYDPQLRLITAQVQMNQKRYREAIQTLSVLALNPHYEEDDALALLRAARKALAEQTAANDDEATAEVAVPATLD
jgi:tetratricopeptide (TPR) repeat protein